MSAFSDGWLDRIVGVQWSSVIGVLEFGYIFAPDYTASTLENTFSARISGDITGDLLSALGPVVAPPTLPADKPDVWCYQPYVDVQTRIDVAFYTFVDKGIYGLLTNKGLITELVDPLLGTVVPFIFGGIGGTEEMGLDVYSHWEGIGGITDPYTLSRAQAIAWAIQAGVPGTGISVVPFLLETLASHTVEAETITTTTRGDTVTFFEPAKLRQAGRPLRIVVDTGPADANSLLRWGFTCSTWKKNKSFPRSSATHELDWPAITVAPIDRSMFVYGGSEARAYAQRIELTIDPETFKITGAMSRAE